MTYNVAEWDLLERTVSYAQIPSGASSAVACAFTKCDTLSMNLVLLATVPTLLLIKPCITKVVNACL